MLSIVATWWKIGFNLRQGFKRLSSNGDFSMGTLKYFISVLFIGFLMGMRGDTVIKVEAEPAVFVVDDKPELKASSAVITFELERLKSETSKLELILEEKNIDLNIQNNLIAEIDKEIEYKSQAITSLQAAVDLQKKESGDEDTQIVKAYARISELERKVENLKGSIRNQKQELNYLELRADEAERKAQEQFVKYEKMENFVTERWVQIRQTEQALHIAEAIMFTAQAEAAAKTDDLMKAYGALLPPWVVDHLLEFKVLVGSYWAQHGAYWAQHGEPVINLLREKISEKVAAANKWAKLHFDVNINHGIIQKWVPTMKKQWQQLTIFASPHIESVKARGVKRFETLRNAIHPHLIKGRDFLEPHAQMVRKFSRPYIAKAASVFRPHLDKARVVLSHCTDQATVAYRRFLVSATTYHYQLQGFVRKTLNKYELTAAFATKELAWLLASALLAMPLFGILMLYPSICSVSRKVGSPVRRIDPGNGRIKPKQRHPDS